MKATAEWLSQPGMRWFMTSAALSKESKATWMGALPEMQGTIVGKETPKRK